MRVYKENNPINTINNIRQILYKLNLLSIETVWFHPQNNIYSVRLENPIEKGKFGTNGKGRSFYYTLASAYGEFIERLQNGFIVGPSGLDRIFLKKIKETVGFVYYPDEKILSQSDFLKLPEEYLKDFFGDTKSELREDFINSYFNRLRENGQDGVISLPFYDVKNKKTIFLPYNLTFILSGSNGMASGNSYAEAIFQALCELIERFSARTVFFDRLTPPNVPDEYLKKFPDECKIKSQLESHGYRVIIKDFSCGINLPAVGVILFNEKQNKYRLNIGSDTSFKIALSRALTEIFQGIENDSVMEDIMLDIPDKEQDYFITNTSENIMKREREIQKFIINGSGVFPTSLFHSEPSYLFSESTFNPKENYQKEINAIINNFISLGFSVYIRDVSFLGFPTFYVYIPSISVWGRKSNNDRPTAKSLLKGIENDKLEDLFFPTQTLLHDSERLMKILNVLAPDRRIIYTGQTLAQILKLQFTPESDFGKIPVNFFLSLLCFANKEYKNAEKFLREFMLETSLESNEYYNSICEYFLALADEKNINKITINVPDEIIESFSTLQKAFSNISFPTCPDCQECPLKDTCLTTINFSNALNIAKHMQPIENAFTIHLNDNL
ncbi:MAG: YcaO-like family protein [Candidatus Cryptobacteroides sp.]|nr:YcaO-like family protein [Candidatus Cryptobacteroides sp.]